MPFLPDWAPNVHPLLVHFPIGLLFTAALVDLVALFTARRPVVRRIATGLYVAGAVFTFVTYLAGTRAADSIFLPVAANATMTAHADLGAWTMWFFAAYALVRLGLSFGRPDRSNLVRFLLFVVGIGGVFLLSLTAQRGAELVFRHGAGVQVVEEGMRAQPVVIDSTAQVGGGLQAVGRGWSWLPTRPSAWAGGFQWLQGSIDSLWPAMVDAGDRRDALLLELDGTPVFFVHPSNQASVQIDAAIDLSEFDGTLEFVHNVGDSTSYRYASFGNGSVRVGRSERGTNTVEGSGPFDSNGWHTIRVFAEGSRFRVYVDTILAARAEGAESQPGPAGLRITGTGRVRIAYVTLTTTDTNSVTRQE